MSKTVRFEEPEKSEPTHGKKFKHTLDSDEEDDEVNEQNYNVMNEDGMEGFEGATVEFDGDIQITPFNLEEEMETGHFDKGGTYIFKKENPDDQDNWLASIDWTKVKQKPEKINDSVDVDSDDDDSDNLPQVDLENLYKQIIELVKPGETIQKGIQRYGKNCPKVQRRNNKKQLKNEEANDSEKLLAKENMLKLSSIADDILRTGDMDIYEKTYEQISLQLSKIAKKNEDVAPEVDMFGE